MAGETAGKPHVLVFETKGEHLRGNPDTDYKQRVLETLQNAFNCGTMTVRDGPMRGTFRLVFTEIEFPAALAERERNEARLIKKDTQMPAHYRFSPHPSHFSSDISK